VLLLLLLPLLQVSYQRCVAPGKSPNTRRNGSTMPLLFSTAVCALRILDAATIFMALVILPIFLMALMRCLTVKRNWTAK
jgi:hypothetical protein